MSPISRENAKRYPPNWKEIADSIRARAEHRCECRGECRQVHPVGGRCEEMHRHSARTFHGVVTLTVAHLDHTPENCDPENLRAMCQRCHNRYDRPHRAANAKARRAREERERRAAAGILELPL